MRRSIILLLTFLAGLGLNARTSAAAWKPSAGHTQVLIWPAAPPFAGPQPTNGPESVVPSRSKNGTPWLAAVNVTQPTMTVYPPKGTNTGAAVIVFPGGGYECLAMDLEGTEICDWLTSRGVSAVLLKYRAPGLKTGPPFDESLAALQDAQRTIRLVRSRARELKINPGKIGVIGFSAGGHLVAAASTRYEKWSYGAMDAADKESCRPDFAIALYPGHLCRRVGPLRLNPNITVTSNTPPTFLLHAQDDPVDDVNHSLTFYIALKNAGVPVEMHLYAEGGHAFGLRPTKFAISKWPQLVETWLRTIHMTL